MYMTAKVSTLTFCGVDILDVDVQAQIASGNNTFTIVGLPDKTIGESRERVRAALSAIGLDLPYKRITVNLAPADLLKEGSHFDLAIACCLLASVGIISQEELQDYLILGELSLDGTINAVAGVLPAAIGANSRGKGVICPAANAKEAAWSGNMSIIAPKSLLALVNHFKGTQVIAQPSIERMEDDTNYP
jgi:magnesium chelatase family protein